MNEPRPWRRAAAWLLFLGPFFFATYGFANWLASRRSGVGSVFYEWERAIPFLPWTIVPYWSIDLLYGLSVFVCTTKRELDRHAQRLLLTQLISVFFFITMPLQFAFERPVAEGLFGALFTALGSFDKPFNQAPSLHIALLIVLWVRLAAHLTSPVARWVLHVWMALIGVSVLTTYQHHFIDIPTGLAAGFFVLWALPDAGTSPLFAMRFTREPRARNLAAAYLAGALVFTALAFAGGTWLWFAWPAGALAIVAMNYAFVGARGFQKDAAGQHSAGTLGLLAPYLVAARWNSRLWTRNHTTTEVADGVSIGRIPSAHELTPFRAVVDLAPEVSCAHPGERSYRHIETLDLTPPSAEVLRAAATAIEEARAHGPVLVCCALGYSRSAAAVAAWLVMTRRAASAEQAAAMVRAVRPHIVLGSRHLTAIESVG